MDRTQMVVTVRGVGVKERNQGADMETVSLTLSREFQAFWQRSLAQCPPGQGVPADEVRRRFGIKDKISRKAG